MKKIAFIGAGSYIFARSLIRDILTYPALADARIALMDIDAERLRLSESVIRRIVEKGKYPATVEATTDRSKALDGADGVLCAITAGGYDLYYAGIDIPMKYGVDYSVGDTRGIPGIFTFLRTVPTMLDICSDIEKYCPNALFLNYTNPMAMLCRAMRRATRARVTGLCHSVQGTAVMLARWIGADTDEVSYTCAGINHQAWFLDYRRNGRDAYPLIAEAVEDKDIYQQDPVRNEMFRHLGYYVTESGMHNSEYNAWFRKRPDLVEQYAPGTHAHVRCAIAKRAAIKEDFEAWAEKPENLRRGNEYAAGIFNAVFGDGQWFKFNGNVPNDGLITNLPEGCCVEVPALASRQGVEPIRVGALPQHLAALNYVNAASEELAVEGALTGDAEKIYRACCLDPLASAVLSLSEIRALTHEMFEANRGALPQFGHF
jgi:alpha-galactosidase